MEPSTSKVTWKSADPDAQLSELRNIVKQQAETLNLSTGRLTNGIWENINAIKYTNEAVQKTNDSVARLQVVVEGNTKRLDDITAEIKSIHQNIDELKASASSTNPIRWPLPSAPPKELVHVCKICPRSVSSDSSDESDHEMEEDEARSEATFRYKVESISKLKESQLSPPFIVRNLPWKIMVMPRSSLSKGQPQRSLGFFVQCNGESKSPTWSCYAVTELRLLSVKEGQEPFSRKIQHLFYPKENDWGFTHFMLWNDVLDPDKGYIKDDAITLEVHVVADAPHGVN